MREERTCSANDKHRYSLLCQELQQLHIHHPAPQRTSSEALQAKNRSLVVFSPPWPRFCPGLEAAGCGSPAEQALQTAAPVCARAQCRARGSAGVGKAE